MGNGKYDHQSINDQKSIFLPMFCRLSLKDVKLNTAPITAAAAEPSSPKVTCIGQVKRNNRVTGYPTSITAAAAYHHKHKKLLPPAKTLLPNPVVGGRRSGSRSCRTNDFRKATAKSKCGRECRKAAVDISEMDPPLPVVKRVAAPPGVGRDEVNIWKRRFNGVKKVEIEPIHLPSNNFQLPPTSL